MSPGIVLFPHASMVASVSLTEETMLHTTSHKLYRLALVSV